MRILITGGCGFLGSHVIEGLFKRYQDLEIVILDKLTYASRGFDRIRDIDIYDDIKDRLTLLQADLSEPIPPGMAREIGQVNYILHLAAETHVDRSIADPHPFIRSNISGTAHILDYQRQHQQESILLYCSTDEVMGPAPGQVKYTELDTPNPQNPYAATKLGAEAICKAYANTYGSHIIITRTMNLFGERQHPEKFIPGTLAKILKGEKVLIHADWTMTIPGCRSYIHARNWTDAAMYVLAQGRVGDIYNIVGQQEVDNLSLARAIADQVGRHLNYEMIDFHSSRPGHDLRYALDPGKLHNLGWDPPVDFWASLDKTIQWYMQPGNDGWLIPDP